MMLADLAQGALFGIGAYLVVRAVGRKLLRAFEKVVGRSLDPTEE